MLLQKYLTGLLLLAALCLGTAGYAQKSRDKVFKKQVVRIIDFTEQEHNEIGDHYQDANDDSTLMQLLIPFMKAGRIIAYTDSSFKHKLNKKGLKKALNPIVPDTTVMIDPVDGKEIEKIIDRNRNGEYIHQYRVLENWSFDPKTGKIAIEIVGIAPIIQLYINGDRSYTTLLWLKYTDAKPVIARYGSYNPDNTLASKVWADYFFYDTPQKEEVRQVE